MIKNVKNKLSIFQSSQEVLLRVGEKLNKVEQPYIISFVNAHAVNLCYTNTSFFEAIIESDLVLRDGSGMGLLYKLLGTDAGENLNGTDLIPLLLKHFSLKKIAVFGSTDEVVGKAAQVLESHGNIITLVASGFHNNDYYIEKLKVSDVDILVLGMGMPKQEILSIAIREKVRKPMIIINGGAILDFISDSIPRAPKWFRVLGVEWIYRLLIEPQRLWRRYIIGNVLFMVRSIKYSVFKQ